MEVTAATINDFFKQQAARDRQIAALVKLAKTLEVTAGTFRDRLMALLPPTVATGDTPNGGPQRKAGAKRAKVTASPGAVEAVRAVLAELKQPVTIKQMRGGVEIFGPKIIGAALRQLAAGGGVTEKRGKWQLATPAGG